MDDEISKIGRFLIVTRHAVDEFWRRRKWVAPSVIEVFVVVHAGFAIYAAEDIFGLTREDFSFTNPAGLLRGVLIWYLLVLVAVFPVFILLEILFAWVRHLIRMRNLSS
jgi:hypothetical protein